MSSGRKRQSMKMSTEYAVQNVIWSILTLLDSSTEHLYTTSDVNYSTAFNTEFYFGSLNKLKMDGSAKKEERVPDFRIFLDIEQPVDPRQDVSNVCQVKYNLDPTGREI